MITIRPAAPSDADKIVLVDAESTTQSYKGLVPNALLELSYKESVCPARIKYWADLILRKSPQQRAIVALENKRVVGFVSGQLDAHDSLDYDSQLEALYVQPATQRRGIGKLLVKTLITEFVGLGAGNMMVWSLKESHACDFYEKIGGVRIKEKPYDWSGTKVQLVAYGWQDISACR